VNIFGNRTTNHLARSVVGYVPEETGFYGHLTGREMLSVCAQLLGITHRERNKELDRVIETVSLEKESEKKIKTYSKGVRQRLSIAQALLKDPRLLLLDEPTSGLDPMGIISLRDLLLDLKKKGVTIFLCSHLLTEAKKIVDRVGILKCGSLIEETEVEKIKYSMTLEDYFLKKIEENQEQRGS
jgi:ABC-2 type transport system ATP-binding protein